MMYSMAEAVFYATLASNHNIKKGVDKFNSWRRKLLRKINPQQEESTVWDKLDRVRKKGKPTVKM